jgi:hypothetical protein
VPSFTPNFEEQNVRAPRTRRHPIAGVSLTLACSIALFAAGAPLAAAGPAATVSDLAWMTGSWKGAAGPGTLEENWVRPDAGTMAALVRGTGAGATNMIELIVIEEAEGSLVLRLQQWNPGYQPRSPEPQEMKLIEVGERMATFEAVSEGGLKRLAYARPADDTFTLTVTTAQGAEFTLELKKQ